MYQITARGPRDEIEAAWDLLAWSDPSPADAVDGKEDTRLTWRLDAYAQTEEAARACVALINEAAPALSPVMEALPDRDWVTLSLEGLPPVAAGRFLVAGSHALTAASPGKIGILIEAGPAFGTGHHGTTLGCLLAFEKIRRKRQPKTILDVGMGSGVLALAALKSGAVRAIGTDIDKDSVRVARENGQKNKVGRRMRSLHGNGVRLQTIQGQAPFDLIFANILAGPLTRLSGPMSRLIAPGGHIILSGLLNRQEPLIRKAYTGRGLALVDRIHRDGWSTLVFQRKA